MSQLHRTLLALALAGIAATGQAATVKVQFDAFIFEGVPAPHNDKVSITFPKKNDNGWRTESVAAGRFQGRVLDYSGVEPSIFVDSPDDLYMYCYDVYDNIKGGWTVQYTINRYGPTARTLDFLGAVNKVLSGSSDKGEYAWLYPAAATTAAAIQLGIWESLYDSGAWDIHGGSFLATGLDVGTQATLLEFFGAIETSEALDGKYAMTLEAHGKQDMITGDPPPSQVPEPGTLALLGAAVIGLLPARRRAGRWSKAA
jgi:PEP-CTERM motif